MHRSLRSRVARLIPRGQALRLGPLRAERRWDGVLVGPAGAHPGYGVDYEPEPLPEGLTSDGLRAYAGRMNWYHEIDLGDGVLTPGMKQSTLIEREWELFALGDLAGRSVLDIGGIDGAYAFLAERHGARRVAVLDHYLWSTDTDHYARIYHEHIGAGITPPAPHESDAWHPGSMPARWRFDTARQALGSRVEAMALDFSDCNLAAVGTWDVVLYLGVLYHMPDPVRALRRVAAVTRGQAIIETEAMVVPGHAEALWRFFPSGELNNDRSNWWVPNMGALLGLVGAAGFKNAEILAGEPAGNDAPGDAPRHYRAIVRAIT